MSITALAQGARGRAQGAWGNAQNARRRAGDARRARAGRAPAEKTSSADVFVLSVPLFIELFMQIMVGNVNQMMLAPHGTDPAAAVGNALQILNIITIALSAMGTASTVLVTRVLGNASSRRTISEIATVALVVNMALGALMTAVLFAFWPQFFSWLHIDATLWGMGSSFLLIVGSTTILQGAFFAITALLRSFARVGDVMGASLAMNAVNVGVGLVLVNGLGGVPALGVEGTAAANVAARVVGLGLAAFMLLRHTDVRPSPRLLRPFPKKTLKNMLGVGIPSSGEQMNYDLAQIVILSFINVLGTTVVTVKVYCSMLASIAYLYSIALSQATQIVLGYLFGAGKFDIVRRRVWMADLIAAVLTTAVSLTLWWNFDAVVGLLTADPVVHELGRQIMLVEVFLGIGRSLNIVMVRALIALGDVRTPVTVNVVFSWVFAVGGGWLLGIGWGWGLVGMWIAMCIDEWLRAGFLIATFARGGWKRRALGSVEGGRGEHAGPRRERPAPIGSSEVGARVSAASEKPELPPTEPTFGPFAPTRVKQGEIVGVNAPSFVVTTALDGSNSASVLDDIASSFW
ncbi:MATE family efflux transporter [Gordonibacter pamelaeae]|uniref:MATE family efflux transporter n=1 Tax=Gordonibacter pamelaeae TaxID=471189 RepID=UPI0012AF470E|nr:MATE family efflux transporter [Gordonibacter pamelaeae]MCQ4846089.1 MATE family efflux transporter [Gordonibacter pamelaeae]MCQ4848712.1 MATE family efflux transporter [Gordonibacter pamelaeae]MSA60518.1 MATE family efflux transporter [Gordonibacter pamelaeae]